MAELPHSLISKAIIGKRRLNQRNIEKFIPILVKYGFKAE
jgi:hypothetical protein